MKSILKTMLYLGVALLFQSCCTVNIDRWEKQDTVLQATYTALHILDWAQTREIERNQAYHELNPILGRHPSEGRINTYFASTLLGHTLVSVLLPKPYRTWWQCVTIGIEAGVTGSNYIIGVQGGF